MKTRAFPAHLILIGLAALFAGLAFSNDRPTQSRWTPAPPKVDGVADDWQGTALRFEKKLGVRYGFQNDSRNLYILIVFESSGSLEAAEATGIALYRGAAGTRDKSGGTRFLREDVPVDHFIGLLENQGQVLTEEDKGILRSRYQYPIFEAYAIDTKGQYFPAQAPRPGTDPPIFRAAKNGDVVTYEFRVPLEPDAQAPAGRGPEPAPTITVGFEWGGSAMQVLSTKASWHSPQSIVSGDVLTGSGETRAQEFLSSFDRLSRPSLKTKAYSFWVDVRLATNP